MKTKTQSNIETEIKNLIAERLSVDLEKIADQTTLTDLRADSLDKYELILILEEKYGIEIKDYDKIKNIGQLIKYFEDEYARVHGGGEWKDMF